jgi:ABC-2 type transport system ATP-binding protein
LDEPTRSLDPVARDELHQVLIGLRAAGDVTTLLSTHDLAEAQDLCDVVSVLKSGRMLAHLTGAKKRTLEAALRKDPTRT